MQWKMVTMTIHPLYLDTLPKTTELHNTPLTRTEAGPEVHHPAGQVRAHLLISS